MRILRVAAAFALLIGLIAACGSESSTTTKRKVTTRTTTRPSPTRLVDAPCPRELAKVAGARCNRLVVPERRSATNGKVVRLFVTRLPSRTQPTAPDPVLVLQGGPGDTPNLASFVDHPLRDGRDVIILDERGTARSLPSLACPEVSEQQYAALGEDIDDPATTQAFVSAARTCRARLTGAGIDLAAYNTAENAADVADLRRALHVSEWNLAGNSYGSRLALTVLRDHPQGVRTVALSGAYPPDRNSFDEIADTTADAFDALFAGRPQLRASFVALIERLERSPVRATATMNTGRKLPVLFDGDNLVTLVRDALYKTELVPTLPGIISQLAHGKGFDAVAQVVADQLPASIDPANFAYGMHYSVQCQEDIATVDLATVRAGAARYPGLDTVTVLRDGYRGSCAVWDVPPQPATIREPVHSDIPVLMMTGALDPTTSPKWALAAAKTLSHGYAFVLPGYGHDTTALDCPRAARNAFFDHPRERPKEPCLRVPPS